LGIIIVCKLKKATQSEGIKFYLRAKTDGSTQMGIEG